MIGGNPAILGWTRRAAVLLVLVIALPAVSNAGLSTVPTDFSDTRVVGTLNQPVGLAIVPDPGVVPALRVLFVEQKTARIGLIVNGAVSTVGVVPSVSLSMTERGLLGIAVDPRWPSAPYIYIHCTDSRNGTHIAISRFTLAGDLSFATTGSLTMDAATRYDLRSDLPDSASNHNGGTVRFGPDGMLYVSLGDDASGCSSPMLNQLKGKILRLDVRQLPPGPGGPAPFALITPADNPFVANSDSSARLVWARGLRNPFRFQIDPVMGSILVGDVGENTWEELDYLDAPGLNLGWPFYEGPALFSSCPGGPTNPLRTPIAYYNHTDGIAVIAASVYRQVPTSPASLPHEYSGDCLYIDYYTGILRRLKGSGQSWSTPAQVPGQPDAQNWGLGFGQVSDMVEAPDGSLWYVRQAENYVANTGEVRRLSYTGAPSASVGSPPSAEVAFAAPGPSPCGPGGTHLRWSQSRASEVRLVIYDVRGAVARVIERGTQFPAGLNDRAWDGRTDDGAAAAPGIYLARLQIGSEVRSRRIVVVR